MMQDRPRFHPGDMVLCRYKNYPVWPAQIAESYLPNFNGLFFIKRPTLRGDDSVMAYWVLFMGEEVGGWVRADYLVPYLPSYVTQMQLPSDSSLSRDLRKSLLIAELKHSETTPRFRYCPADMRRLLFLCDIPIDEFADVKSQSSEDSDEPTVVPRQIHVTESHPVTVAPDHLQEHQAAALEKGHKDGLPLADELQLGLEPPARRSSRLPEKKNNPIRQKASQRVQSRISKPDHAMLKLEMHAPTHIPDQMSFGRMFKTKQRSPKPPGEAVVTEPERMTTLVTENANDK